MNVRSMTGYARVRRAVGDGELTVGVKAVNHRGLDLHFSKPYFDKKLRCSTRFF